MSQHYFERIGIIAFAVLLALILKMFVVDVVWVPTRSMESTILQGDYILINKLITSTSIFTNAAFPTLNIPISRIHRGDVLVFEFPSSNIVRSNFSPRKLIKRCIGLPGDVVEIRKGRVLINGEILDFNNIYNKNINFDPVVVPQKGMKIMLDKRNIVKWEKIIRLEGHEVAISDSEIVIDGKPSYSYTIRDDYLFMLGDNLKDSYDSRDWGFLPVKNVIGRATLIYWSADAASPMKNVSDFISSIRWNRIGTFIY
jgi:signal peptidase I